MAGASSPSTRSTRYRPGVDASACVPSLARADAIEHVDQEFRGDPRSAIKGAVSVRIRVLEFSGKPEVRSI